MMKLLITMHTMRCYVLVTDDYLCEKPYNSLEDYNLDVDYLKELELPKDLDEWKDLNPSDPNEGRVTITFDEGRALGFLLYLDN